jgi:hypothetical protein
LLTGFTGFTGFPMNPDESNPVNRVILSTSGPGAETGAIEGRATLCGADSADEGGASNASISGRLQLGPK